jgi:DNA-binding response OmpR family regulator
MSTMESQQVDGRGEARRLEAAEAPARVWVAEGDGTLRRRIVALLAHEGYEVMELADGEGLLRELTAAGSDTGVPPSLIVTDLSLIGCGGMELLSRLRSERQDIPVILLSAPPNAERLVHAGIEEEACLLYRPFDLEDLLFAALTLAEP